MIQSLMDLFPASWVSFLPTNAGSLHHCQKMKGRTILKVLFAPSQKTYLSLYGLGLFEKNSENGTSRAFQ
jgi:hypothetical protein